MFQTIRMAPELTRRLPRLHPRPPRRTGDGRRRRRRRCRPGGRAGSIPSPGGRSTSITTPRRRRGRCLTRRNSQSPRCHPARWTTLAAGCIGPRPSAACPTRDPGRGGSWGPGLTRSEVRCCPPRFPRCAKFSSSTVTFTRLCTPRPGRFTRRSFTCSTDGASRRAAAAGAARTTPRRV